MSSHTNEMTMVERVARAICAAEGWSLPNDMSLPYSAGSRVGMNMQKARAAIEAMREPNRAMVEAASGGFGTEPSFEDAEYPHEHYLQRSRNSFVAAIDAALQEKQG